jgi:hypothetical protein
VRDAQIRSLLKDDEIQALELHIHMLKDLMHTHGMELPPETSESAPASAPPAENVPTWGNSNAPPVVDLHNNGWGTTAAPSPAPTQENYHGFSDESMEPLTYGKYGKNITIRASRAKGIRDQEAKRATLLTPKESEDETRMKMTSVTVKSSKRLGTLMVRLLLKIGLSL